MNYTVDIIIIVILLLSIFYFANKGLISSILKSCSWLISILVTYFLYPFVSSLLRKTIVFDFLRETIYTVMGLDSVSATNGSSQITAINSLTLPEGLKTMIVDNNNSVIYDLLGVNSLQEYIAGYIANIILNIVISILVFFIIKFCIKLAFTALDIAVKMPVVKQLNSLGGAFLGAFWGVVIIWSIMAITTLLIASPVFSDLINAINNSFIGSILYNNNFIMNVLLSKLFI